ncbi:dTDP-4-dehydrorhamnose 3,5-epimerase family protein [Cupriavidus sp. WS]|uniref:dTDP-4-dehydrorhamnose 3,5-epimerase family protein n=1 Tax=Cupriavidus sp. WS TaxID=1312922 RepID=UPI000372747A|nr:dTDP-4-dehydrorhamnose 3,5-epimerase [Cupriavidus sp. WS]
MRVEPLVIAGCFRLWGNLSEDARGDFFKLFHAPTLGGLDLETNFTESYISTSHVGVIRGMHFQRPPKDHAKLVCCLSGRARDGLVDLRAGSTTFGQSLSLILTGDEPTVLYVPKGVAHGFAAHVDHTRMWYLVSSVHDPAADAGVHPHSVGIDWWAEGPAIARPVLSTRDQRFPALADYLEASDF